MDKSEYQNIYDHETHHFFYVSSHNLVLSLLDKFHSGAKVLDVGCGAGLLAKKLQTKYLVQGVDISSQAVKLTKSRGVSAKIGSIQKLPFSNNLFDTVICLDVLVHASITNKQNALAELCRVLKPGGLLIIRVSANPWLRLNHDQFVNTGYRFSRQGLEELLSRAGFLIQKISFVHFPLLPLAILTMCFEKILNLPVESGIKDLPRWLNDLATKILNFEAMLIQNRNLPAGLALIAVCQKPIGKSKK